MRIATLACCIFSIKIPARVIPLQGFFKGNRFLSLVSVATKKLPKI